MVWRLTLMAAIIAAISIPTAAVASPPHIVISGKRVALAGAVASRTVTRSRMLLRKESACSACPGGACKLQKKSVKKYSVRIIRKGW